MTEITNAHPKQPERRRWLPLALAGLLAGLLLGWAVLQVINGEFRLGPPRLHGTVIQSPEPMSNFTLTGPDGRSVQLRDFRDQVVLIYFGYTYCPDVCPATMNALAKARQSLKAGDQDQVQVLMITVDPERDTAAALAEYLAHFDPSFLGLTGTPEEITTAATPFGIYYQKQAGTVSSGYLVDHTATVVVLDKRGYLRLLYPFNTPAEDIAADLRYLVKD